MEEMVAEFLSFFLFVSYFCLRNECKTYKYKTKKDEKAGKKWSFSTFFYYFCKKYSSQ